MWKTSGSYWPLTKVGCNLCWLNNGEMQLLLMLFLKWLLGDKMQCVHKHSLIWKNRISCEYWNKHLLSHYTDTASPTACLSRLSLSLRVPSFDGRSNVNLFCYNLLSNVMKDLWIRSTHHIIIFTLSKAYGSCELHNEMFQKHGFLKMQFLWFDSVFLNPPSHEMCSQTGHECYWPHKTTFIWWLPMQSIDKIALLFQKITIFG